MPDALAHLLERLLREGRAPRSQFSARSLAALQSLFDAGALRQRRSGGGRVVEVREPETLAAFYRHRYPGAGGGIGAPPRARAVGDLRNAKRAGRSDREPILVRATAPVVCRREDAQVDLRSATLQTGAACLLLEPGRFWSLSATVATVENLECFLHFERLGVDAGVALYAAGRLSELALQWIGSAELTECRFIHCGDYDPVGLDEFLRLQAVGGDRVRLHVPSNLRALLTRFGRPDLLRASEAILRRLRTSPDPDVRRVLAHLHETGCGLDQECLLLADAADTPRTP